MKMLLEPLRLLLVLAIGAGVGLLLGWGMAELYQLDNRGEAADLASLRFGVNIAIGGVLGVATACFFYRETSSQRNAHRLAER